MNRRGFRYLPLRVAVISMLVVGLIYVVAAVAVLFVVRNNLIAGIDVRLSRQLLAIQSRPDVIQQIAGGDVTDLDSDGDARRFDAPLLVWVSGPGGASYQSDAATALPVQFATAAGPVSASIGGIDMRLVGGPLGTAGGAGWVTIAQSVSEATSATATFITAEVLIAPAVLLLVLIGAYVIGRRVAGPIQQARISQLEFTADASHELRTPLTVIAAETSLALAGEDDVSAFRQSLMRIKDETGQLSVLVDDLLWLARFDSTPTPPPAEPIDVGVLAATAVDRFRPICEQRGTTLGFSVVGHSNPVVSVPPEWAVRLLSVLIDNAIHHSPEGSAIKVAVSGDYSTVRLTVEDNGPGIPADQRAQVFARFHRLGASHEGFGLGLAIADAIVGATGGRWEIDEAPGGGARMAVRWSRIASRAFDAASTEQVTHEPADHATEPGEPVVSLGSAGAQSPPS